MNVCRVDSAMKGTGDPMEYRIRRNMFGKREVEFKCRGCGEKILCPLADAGTQQPCPSCGTIHICPGEKEKAAADEVSSRLREAAEREQEASEVKKTADKRRRVETIAEERLRANMSIQDAFDQDQDALRTVDWTDRVMWRAFRFLRWLFAVQVVIGQFVTGFGAVLLAISGLVFLVQASSKNPKYEQAFELFGAGMGAIGAGYALYVTAAIFATIVYIERNTRGILKL